MTIRLGKIQDIVFGFGGYNDAMVGFSITLSGKSWSVQDFKGCWPFKPSKSAAWTYGGETRRLGQITRDMADILKRANVLTLDKLLGTPVEVIFDDSNTLKSWRILEEVI